MKKFILPLVVAGALFAETGSFIGESYRTEVNVGFAPSYVKIVEANSSGTIENVYEKFTGTSTFKTTGSTGVITTESNVATGIITDGAEKFYGFDVNTTSGKLYFYFVER